MKFSEFNLAPTILKQLGERNFKETTPIQERTIPLILSKQDIIGCAKTGSGKTLAFVLPLIHLLAAEKTPCPPNSVRSLILVPTRELVIQIYEEAIYFSKGLNLRLSNAFGGQDYEKQKKKVQVGSDLLVATPGRLLDFYKSKDLRLEEIKYIILDEADRMLDMGFIDEVKYILKVIKRIENISLWSATMDYNVFYSMWSYMDHPEEILINPDSIDKEKVSQGVIHLGSDEKPAYIAEYCKRFNEESIIIFTNTRDMVDMLAKALTQYGVIAEGLSSVINQRRRLKILESFKEKKFNVLVATDLASRGIHVDDINQVINYDVPQDPESYVHRIGRTARAGKKGMSLLICCERDYDSLEKIESYLSYKIPILEPNAEIMDQLPAIKKVVYSNRRSYSKNNERIRKGQVKSSTRVNQTRPQSKLKNRPPIQRATYSKERINKAKSQHTRNESSHIFKNPAPTNVSEDFFDDYPAGKLDPPKEKKIKNGFMFSFKKKLFSSRQ